MAAALGSLRCGPAWVRAKQLLQGSSSGRRLLQLSPPCAIGNPKEDVGATFPAPAAGMQLNFRSTHSGASRPSRYPAHLLAAAATAAILAARSRAASSSRRCWRSNFFCSA